MTLNLNNAALLALLKSDVEEFNHYRQACPGQVIVLSSTDLYRADLRHANLQGAILCHADLHNTDLYHANLHEANLHEANLHEATLTDANLRGAKLRGANLRGAELWHADLHNTDLYHANLRDTDLYHANLQGAILCRADLRNARLSGAKLKGAKLPYNAPAIPNIHERIAEVVAENLTLREWNSSSGVAHCRARWVFTLAGEAGRELEEKIGTDAAAALIYMASDPELEQIPDWVADNEDALEDIHAMAAK